MSAVCASGKKGMQVQVIFSFRPSSPYSPGRYIPPVCTVAVFDLLHSRPPNCSHLKMAENDIVRRSVGKKPSSMQLWTFAFAGLTQVRNWGTGDIFKFKREGNYRFLLLY